jgi:hypothetical protein
MNADVLKEEGLKVFLGGKDRNIFYDVNALILLEKTYGELHVVDEVLTSEKISLEKLRNFLWVGLVHEDKTLTEEEVGSWFNLTNLSKLGEYVIRALYGSLPEKEEVPEGENNEKNSESQPQL